MCLFSSSFLIPPHFKEWREFWTKSMKAEPWGTDSLLQICRYVYKNNSKHMFLLMAEKSFYCHIERTSHLKTNHYYIPPSMTSRTIEKLTKLWLICDQFFERYVNGAQCPLTSASRTHVLQEGEQVLLWRHLRNQQGQLSFSVDWLPQGSVTVLREGTGTAPAAWGTRSGLTATAG